MILDDYSQKIVMFVDDLGIRYTVTHEIYD